MGSSNNFKKQKNACGHVCKYMDQKGSTAMLTSIQSGVTQGKSEESVVHR